MPPAAADGEPPWPRHRRRRHRQDGASQTLAEHFSAIGVSVFLADVKGNFAGLAQPGGGNAKIAERVHALGPEDFRQKAFPVVLWDAYGKAGQPVRTTVRHADRRAQPGVQDCRRPGPPVAGSQGFARFCNMPASTHATSSPNTATSPPPAWAPFRAPCWSWKARAGRSYSASLCWTSPISCRPTARSAAISTSSPPTNSVRRTRATAAQ